MRYDVASLRHAAATHERVAGVIDGVVSELAGLVVDPAAFGGVAAAGTLAAGVTGVGTDQGRASVVESISRRELSGRVGATAGLGEGLSVRTAAIASAVPSSISARM
jgi:hypothetical protein